MKTLYLVTCAVTMLLATGCARKNPNFFVFNQTQKEEALKPLMLPMIKKPVVIKNTEGNKISWMPLTLEETQSFLPDTQFVGYNVYRFTATSFIPCTPCNENPLENNWYLDIPRKKDCTKKYYYLVKAVFKHNETIIEGPGSKIITLQKHL